MSLPSMSSGGGGSGALQTLWKKGLQLAWEFLKDFTWEGVLGVETTLPGPAQSQHVQSAHAKGWSLMLWERRRVLDTNLLLPIEPSQAGEGLHLSARPPSQAGGFQVTSQKGLEPPLSDHGSHEEGA